MDSQSLMCLDWILASTEYIEFVYMMLEFKVSGQLLFEYLRARKIGTARTTSMRRVRLTSMAARTLRKGKVATRPETACSHP